MVDRWNYRLLSSVCEEITSGGAAPQGDKYFINGKHPFVRVVDMGNLHGQKYMLQTRDLLNDVGAEKLRLFPSGTILFTKSGASLLLNQRAILKVPMYVVSHIGCLIPNEAIISEWLYYWMKTVDFNIYAHATTLPSLKLTTIKELRIPVPTIPEQERIVARIEELFSQLDAGVETLKKTKAQLAVYRQAVLKEAFNSAEVDCKMLSIAEILTKTRKGMSTGPFGTMIKKSDHKTTGVPMLGIENIGRGQFVDGNKIYVTAEKAEELKAFSLKAGDIIISRSGTVGEICAVPERAEGSLLSTNLMRVSLDNTMIRSDYFIALFQSKGIVLDQIKELCKGSTRDFLNQTILKQIVFPVPSMEKQEEIVSIIEARMSVCDSIEQTVDTALQQAEAMRQSILKDAFEGRL